MTEVLLSQQILLSLQFNLAEHLTLVRKKFYDTEFSNAGFDPDFGLGTSASPPKGKLASLVRGAADAAHVVDFLDDIDGAQSPGGFSDEALTAQRTTSTQFSTLESEVEAVIHPEPVSTPLLQLILGESMAK